MRTLKEINERIATYKGAKLMYYEGIGYIAWQVTTGENVEILFIEVKKSGQGLGHAIIQKWATELCVNQEKPYNSVIVWRLKRNEWAGKFYRSLGFKETEIDGVYTEPAVLSVINFDTLCKNLSINLNFGKSGYRTH